MAESLTGAPAPKLSDKLRGRQIPHIGVLSREELDEVIALGEWFRDNRYDTTYMELLRGRVQCLLFVYESTRTRLGFSAAMAQLGGSTVYMAAKSTQMGRGESIVDTARAIDQYIDVFAGRLWTHKDIEQACENMHVPVLNACTPLDHSTHVLGELMAIKQAKGKLEGLNLVYTGMARGILHSFIRVCPVLGINLTLAVPQSYAETINEEILSEGKTKAKKAKTRFEVCTNLKKAMKDVDFVQASTLMRSMLAGEQSPEEKRVDIPKWTVTDEVLDCAKPDVVYSHSGPAHRGICATDEVLDGTRSIIQQEANNAIYSKKALLALTVK
ncbi:MAG: ornithine carbamoyltransferase [Planctomycetota bacterium]